MAKRGMKETKSSLWSTCCIRRKFKRDLNQITRNTNIWTQWIVVCIVLLILLLISQYIPQTVCTFGLSSFDFITLILSLIYFLPLHHWIFFSVMPRFTEQIESAVEALSANPSQPVDENEFIDASRLVYDGIRDIRKAVLMIRVSCMPLSKFLWADVSQW